MDDDDKELDEILNEEDNPYNNPDTTFDCEDNAYEAGYELGFSDIKNNNLTDLESEIDYPTFVDKDIKKSFKSGYKNGSTAAVDEIYGDEDSEKKNTPKTYYVEDDKEEDDDEINEDE